MKLFIFATSLVIVLMLFGCDSKRVAQLEQENDSLRQVLNARYSVVMTMREIKLMIDSIDMNRNVLHADLSEGTTYTNFKDRLQDINRYVQQTEHKIDTIEDALKGAKGEASAYLMMVDALKSELQIRADEVAKLEKHVNDIATENKGLVKTVKIQQNEMSELRLKIDTKQQELNLIEAKVVEMVENFKVTEAEALFTRAQAVEEAANRTRLAPAKKRATYREALDLYKKALAMGKKEAADKVVQLEKKTR